jgi:elongator complex protein 1
VVCDAVRTELEKRDLRRFANAVLTAHVSRPTADLEAALRVVLRLRGERSSFAHVRR